MRRTLRWTASALLVTTLLILLPTILWSGVSLKNGNFYIGYTDVVLPGDFLLKVDRTYNSQSDYRGLFGFGWASMMETRLLVTPDGRVRIYENGGGDQTEFVSDAWDLDDVDEAVGLIVRVRGGERTPQERLDYQNDLVTKSAFRDREWGEAVRSGQAEPASLPPGSRLFSNKRGGTQTVTRTADGYRRETANGTVDEFDEAGRLTSITKGAATDIMSGTPSYTIEMSYDANGLLDRMTDPLGRSILFFVGASGRIDSLENGTDGTRARYEYDDRGSLVRSIDVDGHDYRYAYDQLFNMVQIAYDDGTTLDITYQQGENRVASVKERDGQITRYTYDKGDDESWEATNVWRTIGGEDVRTQRVEYTYGRTATGEIWTRSIVEIEQGRRTETVYNECCGLPVTIARWDGDADETREAPDRVASFEYNSRGLLVRKKTDGQQVVLEYDEAHWKPSRIETSGDEGTEWVEYRYSQTGDLVWALDDSGREIDLHYSEGKIDRMARDSVHVDFEYNDIGKPVRISHSELGELRITYDEMGQVSDVESGDTGSQVAMAMTAMFQDLLALVAPAQVGLSLNP